MVSPTFSLKNFDAG